MDELLAKYLSGNASDVEKKEVEQWRAASADNAQEFGEFQEAWILTDSLSETGGRLDDILAAANPEVKEAKVVGWPSYMKYAAAVALLVMIGTLWMFGGASDSEAPEVFAGSGQVLDDGTILSLKGDARVVSVDMTDAERVVKVEGKVFFEVTHDPERPFYVVTDNAKVKVLGTSFLVDATEDFTEVCVETGKVNFATATNGMSLDLTPGEMGTIGRNIKGIAKRRNTNENFLSWKDGLMVFKSTDIPEVIRTLEDSYNVTIDAPLKASDCQFTSKFNKKSLEEVIQILSASFNWQYDINKDKVVLSGEGC